MREASTIQVSVDDDGVALLTLADPGKRNALSRRLSTELAAAVGDVLSDGARSIVLAAEPPAFCAGEPLDDLLNRDHPRTIPELVRRTKQVLRATTGYDAAAPAAIAAELEAQQWSVDQPYFEETVKTLRARISSR